MSDQTPSVEELVEQGYLVVHLDRMRPLIGGGDTHLPFPDSTVPLHWGDWLMDHGYTGLDVFHEEGALPGDADPGLVLVTGEDRTIVRVVTFTS